MTTLSLDPNEKVVPFARKTVMKSNGLVKAAYRLTANEQRLVVCAISNVYPDSLSDWTICRVTASDMAKLANSTKENFYNGRLYKIANQLQNRRIVIRQEEHSSQYTHVQGLWIDEIHYDKDKDQASIGIQFTKIVVPYLQDFSKTRGHFTKYQIQDIQGFKSVYGMRFYEIIANQRNIDRIKGLEVSEIEFEIDWLRDFFGLKDKYKTISNFRSFVIKPAISDFSQQTCPIHLAEAPHPRGKKRKSFTLFASDKEAAPQRIRRTPKPSEWAGLFRGHARPGENEQQARSRIQGLINKGELLLS